MVARQEWIIQFRRSDDMGWHRFGGESWPLKQQAYDKAKSENRPELEFRIRRLKYDEPKRRKAIGKRKKAA